MIYWHQCSSFNALYTTIGGFIVFSMYIFAVYKYLTYFIYSIEFAEVECHINIQNAEPDSQDFASANETLAKDDW